jgi:hypothetical protein
LAERFLRLHVLRLRLKVKLRPIQFAIHKEKEMVAFRRVVLALAVIALFAGMASADVIGGSTQLTCNTNVTVTPQLRGEGWTEQTGDIIVTCTGGAVPVASAAVPLVNFTIFYGTTVTSRLNAANSASEALLLIDEPGSGLTGDGPLRAQKTCTTPLLGCVAYVSDATNTAANGGIPFSTTNGVGTYAPNVYQGVVSGNSVTFFGIPVLAPTSLGSRVFRITNVRVNAVPLSGVATSGGTPVQASISISPAGTLLISNSTPNVGFVSPSLTVSASNGGNFQQCVSKSKAAVSTLSFTENFGTAFKTRIDAQANASQYAGQTGLTFPGGLVGSSQAVPGKFYNSESNFVYPVGSFTAGLADFGTRLKASFANLPPGTHVYVSMNSLGAVPPVIGGGGVTGGVVNQNVSYASLVSSDTVSDGNFTLGSAYLPSLVDQTTGTTSGGVLMSEIPNVNGVATATWEVLNTNPNTDETFQFGVYITYSANVAQNIPVPGISTVAMSYAPIATSGAASASLPIPRFVGPTTTSPIYTIVICRTVLLYPYITNQAGFDTGLTVANTTTDPFGTAAQAGACTLNWYGGTTAAPTTAPGPTSTGTVASGTVWVNTLQAINPNFQGYMIAVCNFQYAHGFAFISDVGARNLAMGYLAVVLTDGRSNTNTTTAENGGN